MARTTKHPQPLPPAVFHLLLALRDGEQHGYALMQQVEQLTDGAVRMGPGTLYGAIKRMLAGDVVVSAPVQHKEAFRAMSTRTKLLVLALVTVTGIVAFAAVGGALVALALMLLLAWILLAGRRERGTQLSPGMWWKLSSSGI